MTYNKYKDPQKRKNYKISYNKKKYDRVSLVLPKGTKDKIKTLNSEISLNSFIRTAIEEKLMLIEKGKKNGI